MKSYLTRDGPISFYHALGVDIAGVGQAVSTADFWFAAFHLISRETGLTSATMIGALGDNENSCT